MHAQVEAWIADQKPDLQHKYFVLREMILACHPAILECYTYQAPFYKLHGLLFYFSVQKKGKRAVMGFCDGHLLQDPSGILHADEGQKYIRQIYLEEIDAHLDAVQLLILDAVDLKLKKNKKNK